MLCESLQAFYDIQTFLHESALSSKKLHDIFLFSDILLFSRRFDFTKVYRKDQWKWRQIVNSINSSNRYDEYKDYDFRRGGWQGGTGHFTQVVWKDSKELGMGRAKTGDGRLTFVVGRYRPAGNVINFMQDNVFPRRGR